VLSEFDAEAHCDHLGIYVDTTGSVWYKASVEHFDIAVTVDFNSRGGRVKCGCDSPSTTRADLVVESVDSVWLPKHTQEVIDLRTVES